MKSRRYGAAFAILAALLLILLAMNLCIGSVNIPLSEIMHILMKNSGSDTYTDIVMNIRFPRALAAAVLVSSQVFRAFTKVAVSVFSVWATSVSLKVAGTAS